MRNLKQPPGPEVRLAHSNLGLADSKPGSVGPGDLGNLISAHSRSLVYQVVCLVIAALFIWLCWLLGRQGDFDAWWIASGVILVTTLIFVRCQSQRSLLLYEKGLCLKSKCGSDKTIYWSSLTYFMIHLQEYVGIKSVVLYSESSGIVKVDMYWSRHRAVRSFAVWLERSIPVPPDAVPVDSVGYRVGRWLARAIGRSS